MLNSNKSRNDLIKERFAQLSKYHDTGDGRTVEELLKTNEILRGYEALRLRRYLSTERFVPERDFDALGFILMSGNLSDLQLDFEFRIETKLQSLKKESTDATIQQAKDAVIQNLQNVRYGPTGVPIYNVLGQFMVLAPHRKAHYLSIAKWLIEDAKLPVTTLDYSGSSSLRHQLSTKPALELEYAEMLYNAGGCDVNDRNRYGATVAHDIAMIYDWTDAEVVRKAYTAMKWVLEHGGNVDIADSDGMTARTMLKKLARRTPQIWKLVEEEDKRRAELGKDRCCATCGRVEEPEKLKLLRCGKCKGVKYCDPKVRACQRLDWPVHKKTCKAA
ncbi:hypothetical protein CC1G_08105 [Coprinopsis cinerea okayama7|uniref:MYND-type domain-containing protein n=1 Tax=Coprinopsis cinerea (strain Okayama-7 / 130 / ATCC MYA-4618 / FGSC 9003) TaxID=240176 RepID=A8NVI1_COPC7|nr:hypothetical protein CC1G_08105 [Coprinopsis cinerea okayama7\|eukprot:XP_001836720.1 hypothetical protein CC1G_08105 [Coprinopsis cinerea okayama7\